MRCDAHATWPIHTWHDSLIDGTWLILSWNVSSWMHHRHSWWHISWWWCMSWGYILYPICIYMMQSYVWHEMYRHECIIIASWKYHYDMKIHPYVWGEVNHSYVWHDAFICVTWSIHMGWLRLVGSLKLYISLENIGLFYRALLQKIPIILRSLLAKATPYQWCEAFVYFVT